MTKENLSRNIQRLSNKIDTYIEVASSNTDILKEVIHQGNYDFAIKIAEEIANHIRKIPAMKQKIKTLQILLNSSESEHMKRQRKKEYKITVAGGRKREWNQSQEGFEAFYNILISAAKLKSVEIRNIENMKRRMRIRDTKGNQ